MRSYCEALPSQRLHPSLGKPLYDLACSRKQHLHRPQPFILPRVVSTPLLKRNTTRRPSLQIASNEDKEVKLQEAVQTPMATDEGSDVEELQGDVADLESQMKEVLAKYSNFEERLDVVERQLLDMARDALEASQEGDNNSTEGTMSDTEDEVTLQIPGRAPIAAVGAGNSKQGKGQSSGVGNDWEERKQHLAERQLHYMQAAEQATTSSEKAGLLGMVAALGEALSRLGHVPLDPKSMTPTLDGYIQLPPAGSGFCTLKNADMEQALLDGTSILSNDSMLKTSGEAGGSKESGQRDKANGTTSSGSREGRADSPPPDASFVKSSGQSDEDTELRIAQARRGGKSIVQARLQADLESRQQQLIKEGKKEEQRRREVEQGGSMATTVPLQAALPHRQGYGTGGDESQEARPDASPPEPGKVWQFVGEDSKRQDAGQQQQQQGEGDQQHPDGKSLLEGVEFKSAWWRQERDDEVEEYIRRMEGIKSVEQKAEEQNKEHEEKERDRKEQGILSRSHVYEINRLQSAITEIANSGYIESVKQLRETLLIQEWDMSNRHLAKKRAISMFERYLVEYNMYDEAGGFEVIGALYEDPDSYIELLVSERLRGLVRSMMEECMSERRMLVYHSCNATAREIAMRELNASGLSSLFSMKEGLWGIARRLWGIASRIVLPFKFW